MARSFYYVDYSGGQASQWQQQRREQRQQIADAFIQLAQQEEASAAGTEGAGEDSQLRVTMTRSIANFMWASFSNNKWCGELQPEQLGALRALVRQYYAAGNGQDLANILTDAAQVLCCPRGSGDLPSWRHYGGAGRSAASCAAGDTHCPKLQGCAAEVSMTAGLSSSLMDAAPVPLRSPMV